MSRKPIYFTSDHHFWHKNIIKFDDRPFQGINHMHKVLINNYNACVPEHGICYFLGDMGFCSSEKLGNIMKQLNGVKIAILGNHDRGVNAMYNLGFDAVLYGAVMYIAGQRVTMSHCPLKGVWREDTTGMNGATIGENWHREMDHHQFTFSDEGQFHLHGHIHPTKENGKDKILGRQIDISVTSNNYRPVSISVIESTIVKILQGEK